MPAFNKNSASISKKTNSRGNHFEALESRQLMSASLAHLATPEVMHVKEELHVHVEKPAVKVKAALTVVTTPIKILPAVSFVEPKVNSKVAGWKDYCSNPLFAPGGPSPNDIIQGAAADCWFVASLAEVAIHDPARIESSISERSDGTYDVYFHTSPTTTIDEHVDGWLPVNSSGGLEYAKLGTDNCTWVAIMEKAFTYFRKPTLTPAYTNINYGWGDSALADLGGLTTEVLPKVSNASELFTDVGWGMILNLADDFMTKASGPGPLVSNHEYSVISVQETSSGVEEIEVRNPYGNNPHFTPNANGYGATNNGYVWVTASSVFPQLHEFVTANV